MSADIYTIFRQLIGDTTPDYDLPDLGVLKFLDLGIDKLSQTVNYKVVEDVVISSSDITAGYKELSKEIILIYESELAGQGISWELAGGKKIRFIEPDNITAGTYEFTYKARYKKFDGVVRENSYFDYNRNADLGIVFWGLAEYQSIHGIIKTDGSKATIVSRSEEGLNESYGTAEALQLSNPTVLRSKAIDVFRGLSNKSNFIFSITV